MKDRELNARDNRKVCVMTFGTTQDTRDRIEIKPENMRMLKQ